ncbi:MAG: hypothetical protein J5903_00245 [Clostridia bacterium]|nr:hypothetical protein [Clostridia bacterium]
MNDAEVIADLKAENEYLKGVIKRYEEREEEISRAEAAARKKADEIEKSAEKLFDTEADRLRLFKLVWDKKFAALSARDKSRYESLNALAIRIDGVIRGEREYAGADFRAKTETLRRMLTEEGDIASEGGVFIGDAENGFSLDDVLDPKEKLDLETLCKEMGLMEE